MYRFTPTAQLWRDVEAFEDLAEPTRGQNQEARLKLAELARRDDRPGCGTRSGFLRHVDQGTPICVYCATFEEFRSQARNRQIRRANAKRRSPAKVLQEQSRAEHAAAWQEFLASERGKTRPGDGPPP